MDDFTQKLNAILEREDNEARRKEQAAREERERISALATQVDETLERVMTPIFERAAESLISKGWRVKHKISPSPNSRATFEVTPPYLGGYSGGYSPSSTFAIHFNGSTGELFHQSDIAAQDGIAVRGYVPTKIQPAAINDEYMQRLVLEFIDAVARKSRQK